MHHDVICFASVHQLLLGPAVHMSSTMVDSEHCMTSCWDCVIMFLNILPTMCIYSELHYCVSAWWKYVASVAPNPKKHSLSIFCFAFGTFPSCCLSSRLGSMFTMDGCREYQLVRTIMEKSTLAGSFVQETCRCSQIQHTGLCGLGSTCSLALQDSDTSLQRMLWWQQLWSFHWVRQTMGGIFMVG